MGKDEKVYSPLLDIDNVLSILSKISIFGGLSEKQLHFLFKLLRKVSYRAGEYIFRHNDEPRYIYVVKSGQVKIEIDSEDGILKLCIFGIGECFGETSVIGIQRHSANAIAMEDSELIVLSREVLLSIFDQDKELFSTLILNIAREACRRLHKADEVLLHYVHHQKLKDKGLI